MSISICKSSSMAGGLLTSSRQTLLIKLEVSLISFPGLLVSSPTPPVSLQQASLNSPGFAWRKRTNSIHCLWLKMATNAFGHFSHWEMGSSWIWVGSGTFWSIEVGGGDAEPLSRPRQLWGASVRNSAYGKGHEEGGLAYAKAWSSLRKPPVPEHRPPKPEYFTGSSPP